ncbi:MAG: L,D-transpeptidase family protein [Rhizomicrobium sp.]
MHRQRPNKLPSGGPRKPPRLFVLAGAAAACIALAAAGMAAQPASPNGAPANVPAPQASDQPQAQAIEASTLTDELAPEAQAPLLVKVETLLDRAHFSPGAIDGQAGANLHNALRAYAQAHGLPSDGTLTPQVFAALAAADKGPVTQTYTITGEDEKGPFIGRVPRKFSALAKLRHLGFRDPVQELAERFHMSEALLRSLNPSANFRAPGTEIVAVRPGNGDLGNAVARVEVNKSDDQVKVFDGTGSVIATFPATVGNTERPAPSGRWHVKFVTFNPTYIYNPRRLTFGDKSKGVLTIAPGPNNPVGTTWIELTKPTYGIHGSPDPERVGKTASHGCVRLTNWDAATLGHAVSKGTPVLFVGQTNKG